jgi:hypothetical protein
MIDRFVFEAATEGLDEGIVVAVALPAHAGGIGGVDGVGIGGCAIVKICPLTS